MRYYRITRAAVLIDLLAETLVSDTSEIVETLKGTVIGEEDAGQITQALEEMDE
jgi:hypothetical protein